MEKWWWLWRGVRSDWVVCSGPALCSLISNMEWQAGQVSPCFMRYTTPLRFINSLPQWKHVRWTCCSFSTTCPSLTLWWWWKRCMVVVRRSIFWVNALVSLSRRLCWYRIMLWESETCPYLAVVCNNSSDRELISLLALRHSSSAKRTKRWSMQSIYPINFHGQESRSGVLPKIQVRMRTLITAISSINSLIRHHEIT